MHPAPPKTVWRFLLVKPGLRKWSQEGQEFKVILSYFMSSRPAWGTQDPVLKKQNDNWVLYVYLLTLTPAEVLHHSLSFHRSPTNLWWKSNTWFTQSSAIYWAPKDGVEMADVPFTSSPRYLSPDPPSHHCARHTIPIIIRVRSHKLPVDDMSCFCRNMYRDLKEAGYSPGLPVFVNFTQARVISGENNLN